MLKFQLFGEPRLTVHLKLIEENDTVAVVAVDENGERLPRGYIARFSGGKLLLHRGVNPDLGLALNEQGALETELVG